MGPAETDDTLRAMMLGTARAEEAVAVLSTLGKMGRLSGVTKSPEFVRQFTKFWLSMGKDVGSPTEQLAGHWPDRDAGRLPSTLTGIAVNTVDWAVPVFPFLYP